MPLSNKDLSDIAKEYAVAKGDQGDAKEALPNIQAEILKKQDQASRVYIPYNNAHIERITPYETEHRWLDGTTYTTITQSQIETVDPTTGKASYFFPLNWEFNNAKLSTNANGNPKTTSINSESYVLNSNIENNGLIALTTLLRNGQSSAVLSDVLSTSYSPGDPTIEVNNSGHTNGNLLYISGSGTSALVRITNVATTTLTITEIIAPANTINAISSSVVENIVGFTNAERNTLISSTYQRILTELTNRIITSAGVWNTALNNQLAQLNVNIDAEAQITAAKTNVNNAKTGYNTWLALSNTGVSGKFVDTSLNNLASAYNTKYSLLASRVSQITTALGSVSQDAKGNYSGVGLYLQRFKCLNFLINGSDGPLFAVEGLKKAKTTFEEKVSNVTDKLATFSNLVRYGAATADPTTNTIVIDNASSFSVADKVKLTGNDLPTIDATISSISGSSVVLNITIPKQYTKSTKAGIIKSI